MDESFAIGVLTDVEVGDGIVAYLRGIDATLAPYGGRFLVHGAPVDVREGTWAGDLVVIGFPSADGAREWYESAAYQAIAHLRTDHSRSTVVLVRGAGDGHLATDVLRDLVRTS